MGKDYKILIEPGRYFPKGLVNPPPPQPPRKKLEDDKQEEAPAEAPAEKPKTS